MIVEVLKHKMDLEIDATEKMEQEHRKVSGITSVQWNKRLAGHIFGQRATESVSERVSSLNSVSVVNIRVIYVPLLLILPPYHTVSNVLGEFCRVIMGSADRK